MLREPTPDQALATATAAGYRADWERFTAWCAAMDHPVLPSTPAAVLEFLDDHPAPAGSTRRLLAAIAHVHHRFGHHSPTADPSVRGRTHSDTLIARQAAGPTVPPERVDRLIRAIPVTGWPTGLFGRRDRLLLLLRFRAGLTIHALTELGSDALAVRPAPDGGPGHLLVTVDSAQPSVQLAGTDEPSTCPACCWVLWHDVLAHLDMSRWSLQRMLRRPITDPTEHHCRRTLTPIAEPRAVLPPLDRWGASPVDVGTSLSRRSIPTIAAEHLAGTAPSHPDRQLATVDQLGASDISRQTVTPARITAESTRAAWEAGIRAHREAVEAYGPINERLEELEADVDAMNARILQLLSYDSIQDR